MTDFAALTERQRAVWSAGDWPTVAPRIESATRTVIERLGVSQGHDFLDVATGTGIGAILAAQQGARVTGLDLVPELVRGAEERARQMGIEGTWVAGDAQSLPFEDDSFDRISSVFGAMFAPDHRRAASELVRVCRPDGTIAVTAWTPEGMNGRMFMTLGKHLPPPPEGFQPPVLWGTEDHVRSLFEGCDIAFERHHVVMEEESTEAALAFFEQHLGPMVLAKAVLDPQGRWEAVREELIALDEEFNEATDGSFRGGAEYLLTIVRPG